MAAGAPAGRYSRDRAGLPADSAWCAWAALVALVLHDAAQALGWTGAAAVPFILGVVFAGTAFLGFLCALALKSRITGHGVWMLGACATVVGLHSLLLDLAVPGADPAVPAPVALLLGPWAWLWGRRIVARGTEDAKVPGYLELLPFR